MVVDGGGGGGPCAGAIKTVDFPSQFPPSSVGRSGFPVLFLLRFSGMFRKERKMADFLLPVPGFGKRL